MEAHFKAIGTLLIILAATHIFFPIYFNWKNELQRLSLINKQMMVIHTFFVALTVFLIGILCLTSAKELVETALGKTISAGCAVFWTCRLAIQFFGYSAKLWKGKRFETSIHIIFSALWLYLSFVFWINYFH